MAAWFQHRRPLPGRDPLRQNPGDQDGWSEHAAFMDELVDDGFIILGGPIGGGEQTLHAVETADEREIRARLDLDPWAAARLLHRNDRTVGAVARQAPRSSGALIHLKPIPAPLAEHIDTLRLIRDLAQGRVWPG